MNFKTTYITTITLNKKFNTGLVTTGLDDINKLNK